ncbi:polar amino acid ABC transporter ATP-binding protein [Carnobacterium maltaromaticum]|uniref:amino acid ABC transporter ATP-binding protein n=1 Tax=Carnobacterium maltaromaticum TaxID=2751 RepID=UPI000C770E4E|nr:ATP-binding cassette domain-containing protein [Carnobacterium maltaromaticum]PLS38326.1 polar amino acid ABC transporter ATP-binding protein [Carnobacterium maltaromaticum]PLS38703.1 polar amino acid ABC transporter ATP-binding protein [Carnobacterium maltaromaticum]PLS39080.1 polar amino acid ABC transporter ATP-binding protein [Carnobacterium maltaromaticum]PLS45350.1 polar amino acid ABC transporter ATP-binding protein [Carnobacterium maltaromaticum]PLS48206.1 polar amino acid ABC trans
MILEVKNVTKKFNGLPVIQNFDFSIAAGEIVTLVGKSGTGKTTLMRLINNLEKADSGTIKIGNQLLCETKNDQSVYASKKDIRAYHNSIGMVFQDYELFPNLTVLENCLEAPIAQKLDTKSNLIKKAEELLGQVGLSDKIQVMPSTLSGGQKQRVAIARAMMLNPKILCFDEPTSALDRESTVEIGKMIQKIATDQTGILIVTHDLEFAEDIVTRVVSSEEFINK